MISHLPVLGVKLRVTVLNSIPLVQFPPNLRVPELIALKSTLQQVLLLAPVRIIFDLSATTFIDESIIFELGSSLKLAQEQGVEIVFWSVNPQLLCFFIMEENEQIIFDLETEAINPANTKSQKSHTSKIQSSLQSRAKGIADIILALLGIGITATLFISIVIAIVAIKLEISSLSTY